MSSRGICLLKVNFLYFLIILVPLSTKNHVANFLAAILEFGSHLGFLGALGRYMHSICIYKFFEGYFWQYFTYCSERGLNCLSEFQIWAFNYYFWQSYEAFNAIFIHFYGQSQDIASIFRWINDYNNLFSHKILQIIVFTYQSSTILVDMMIASILICLKGLYLERSFSAFQCFQHCYNT